LKYIKFQLRVVSGLLHFTAARSAHRRYLHAIFCEVCLHSSLPVNSPECFVTTKRWL